MVHVEGGWVGGLLVRDERMIKPKCTHLKSIVMHMALHMICELPVE